MTTPMNAADAMYMLARAAMHIVNVSAKAADNEAVLLLMHAVKTVLKEEKPCAIRTTIKDKR